MTSATIGLPDRYRPLDQIGPDAVRALSHDDLRTIDAPERYLGSAEALRRRLLSK